MKHPNPENWSDFVRGVLDSGIAAEMKNHLGQGCNQCKKQVSALEAVLRIAETDLRIEPPAFAVQSVKNLFRVQRLIESTEKSRLRLNLSFDSFLTPAPIAVRASGAIERHLVYESAELTLELQLQAHTNAEPLKVKGQLMGADSAPIADVPAFLLQGGRIFSHALSGSQGDFSLLGDSNSSPHVCLLIEDEQLVDVELPSLLADASGSTH